jgi:hypothetical protein
MSDYAVLVIDMYHYDEESEVVVGDFPSYEVAREYARRRTRDSLEELRKPGQSDEELRGLWGLFGEDCLVIGGEPARAGPLYAGYSELEFFAQHSASEDERDWVGLGRRLGVKARPRTAGRQ